MKNMFDVLFCSLQICIFACVTHSIAYVAFNEISA